MEFQPPFLFLTLADVGALFLTSKLTLPMKNYFPYMLRANFVEV